jgi:predicted transcriptional regulator
MRDYAAMVRCGRAALGISQSELSKRTGVGSATIARIERGGNAKFLTFKKIIDGLKGCGFSETKNGFVMTYEA